MIISALPSAWLLLVSQPDASVMLTEQQPALCSTDRPCLARARGCIHRGWTTLHSQPFLGDELKNCRMPRWPAGLGLPGGPAFGFVGCLLELALAGCCMMTGVSSGPLAGSSAAPSGSSGQQCHKVRDACDWSAPALCCQGRDPFCAEGAWSRALAATGQRCSGRACCELQACGTPSGCSWRNTC